MLCVTTELRRVGSKEIILTHPLDNFTSEKVIGECYVGFSKYVGARGGEGRCCDTSFPYFPFNQGDLPPCFLIFLFSIHFGKYTYNLNVRYYYYNKSNWCVFFLYF